MMSSLSLNTSESESTVNNTGIDTAVNKHGCNMRILYEILMKYAEGGVESTTRGKIKSVPQDQFPTQLS